MFLCGVTKMNHLPTIPWESTFDDMNNCRHKYSFITEPKNNYINSSITFNENRDLALWLDNDNKYREDVVNNFKTKVKDFLELLVCLVHVTGGQPARGTELSILQHTNGCNTSNPSRNIYIDRGMVCIYSRYHKNILKANKTKDIFRFLPPRVGSLMVYYLWLVLPHYQNVVGCFEGKNKKSNFLWTNEIVDIIESEVTWDSTKFSSLLKGFFAKTCPRFIRDQLPGSMNRTS
jgi:hypothetical protein